MTKNKNNQAIWSTRIKRNTSSLFQEVGNSINIDKRYTSLDYPSTISKRQDENLHHMLTPKYT